MQRLVLAAIILGLIGLSPAAIPATAAPTPQGGPRLNLVAGYGDGVISMNGFSGGPIGVRVAVGTTVAWTGGSDEFHTVTFLAGRPAPLPIVPQPEDPTGRPPMLNPDVWLPTPAAGPWDGTTFVSSGQLNRDQEFSVTFARAGSYPYVCIFHVNAMTSNIEVVAPGSPGITATAPDIAAHTTNVHESELALIYSSRNRSTPNDGPNGTTIWSVLAGTDWKNGHLDVLAFMPDTLTVRQGDTVFWYVDQNVPHTVTFVDEGATKPDFVVVQLPDGTMVSFDPTAAPPPPPSGAVDPSQMPRLVIGPVGLPFKANPTHTGAGLYNSGIIGFEANHTAGGSATWALTFDAPGTFSYYCALHEELGMIATITVTPR